MNIIPKEAGKPALPPMKTGQLDTNVTPETLESAAEPALDEAKEKLSPKYAQLARREQALRAKELEIKAKEDAIKAKEEDYRTRYIPKEEVGKRLTSNFQEASSEFGISYDQMTQSLLNQPNAETLAYEELKKEIQALKAEKEQEKVSQVEKQKSDYTRAVEQIRNEALKLVESDPEFETIKELEQAEQIVAHIEEVYAAEGRVLKVSEAAKIIEDRLIEQSLRVAKLKKVQAQLAPKPEEIQAPAKSATAPAMKTLTNSVGAARPLSPRERALLAFKGELK